MIGIFDSGFGGLTILKKIIEENPGYEYIYLGDNARAPYGSKSEELIYQYTREATSFLMEKGCELIIIACNTASAKALRQIQQKWLPQNHPNKKVLGVIIPVAEAAIEAKKEQKEKDKKRKNKIGLIGTQATINSQTYERELKKLDSNIEIFSKKCPLLVPLIEEGWIERRETKMILRYYLRGLKRERVNFLILGCTHYPILFEKIKGIMGEHCQIINPPEVIALKLKQYLENHPEIEKKIKKNKKRTFYTTDDPKRFKSFAPRFWEQNIKKVKKISLH